MTLLPVARSEFSRFSARRSARYLVPILAWAAVSASTRPSLADGLWTIAGAADAAGPSLVVIGVEDAHGDAAVRAVRQLRWITPDRGRLVLVQARAPLSEPALEDDWEVVDSLRTLEQRFPKATFLVLRESYDSYRFSAGGQGFTLRGDGDALPVVAAALRNSTLPEASSWKIASSPPAAGPGRMTVTTSAKNPRKEQRPAIRAAHHRIAVWAMLVHLQMVDAAWPHQLLPPASAGRIRVAVYDDDGSISSSGHGPAWLRSQLEVDSQLRAKLICRADLLGGALQQADVLVVGGGSSRTQAKGLGPRGREMLRQFVDGGGGYVGICAGAFLAGQPREGRPYVGLLPVRSRGNSGSFVTPLEWYDSPLGPARREPTKYSNGPRLELQENAAGIEVWSRFATARAGEQSDEDLVGQPAVLGGRVGAGRVVVFSSHCERYPTAEGLLIGAVRWTAGAAESDR